MNELFVLAREMRDNVKKNKENKELSGKVVATLFYEESTRTRLSFESAALRLGASTISTANARQFSSVAKGETLEDTIRTLNGYADCIVLRYYEEGGAARAAHVSNMPVINAGDGSGQHPTQSLLDVFTIEDELGQVDGTSLALVGDLKHGRTVHSLAYLMGKFEDISMLLVSPKNLQMPEDILKYLKRHKIKYKETTDLEKVKDCDVVYQTRIQKERFDSLAEYEASRGKLVITEEVANKMKKDAIILHPLPRVDEIAYGVDSNHRAKYFQQAENGLYVRMALLKMLLGK